VSLPRAPFCCFAGTTPWGGVATLIGDADGRGVATLCDRPDKAGIAALFVAAPAMLEALRLAEEFYQNPTLSTGAPRSALSNRVHAARHVALELYKATK